MIEELRGGGWTWEGGGARGLSGGHGRGQGVCVCVGGGGQGLLVLGLKELERQVSSGFLGQNERKKG